MEGGSAVVCIRSSLFDIPNSLRVMMASGYTDIQGFFAKADNVALLVGADDVFGLLKRSVNLPGAWAALVTRESGSK